eukprot:TRINITY_DN2813_c0_g1_i1.p1 TRINITY_DN2813_c0_g1~~TRINITY_DN2813_c0_g1_i1.p1  ORF type:complete len:282 (+),score=93.96 TRINITY_DN2813_c0_g1_i1:69-848(+)
MGNKQIGGQGNKQTKERLQRAKDTKVLALVKCQLSNWSKLLSRLEGLEDLRSLDLSDNKLDGEVPREFARFGGLKILSLDGNNLHGCTVLGQLSSLEDLSAARNAVTSLPDLRGAPKLKQLNLSHNAISTCHDPLCFAGLRLLRVVRLSHNRMQMLPSSLVSLPGLVELDVSHNALESFAEEGEAAQLKQLQHLDLRSNRVRELPRTLFTETRLNQLLLDGNPLTVEQLREHDYTAAWQERQRAAVNKQLAGGLVVKLN